jgi:hypothetical protein
MGGASSCPARWAPVSAQQPATKFLPEGGPWSWCGHRAGRQDFGLCIRSGDPLAHQQLGVSLEAARTLGLHFTDEKQSGERGGSGLGLPRPFPPSCLHQVPHPVRPRGFATAAQPLVHAGPQL